ncbi:MAG TPA: hypothetical protein VFW40_03560 [Capsulimonadaceae bacterium]|nr:hypothetical protein [Capsulimonadaceae bacterium]
MFSKRRIFSQVLVTLSLFLTALAVSSVEAGANAKSSGAQVIYADSLQNGWQPWGWAKAINYKNAKPVHGGKMSIAVTITKGYDALYIHHAAFNTKGYRALSFWANGGAKGGQMLQIQATVKGKPVKVVVEGPLAKKWSHIVVPLTALGVANKSGVDGFWIQDHTGHPLPTFYVDDISLTY